MGEVLNLKYYFPFPITLIRYTAVKPHPRLRKMTVPRILVKTRPIRANFLGNFAIAETRAFTKYLMTPEGARTFTTGPIMQNIRKVGVQGACFELGQRKTGVADGPRWIRETKFMGVLRQIMRTDIIDYGDVNLLRTLDGYGGEMFYPPKSKTKIEMPRNSTEKEQEIIRTHRLFKQRVPTRNIREVGGAAHALCESTYKIIQDGRVCLTLGGDHSIAIGTLAGSSKAYEEGLAVIWIDAHSDLNTPTTSNTGNVHGMSVAYHLTDMAGFMSHMEPSFKNMYPRIKSDSIVYIGLRDVEPFERSFLNMLKIKAFSMKEIDQMGINSVMEQVFEYLMPNGVPRPTHISLDVDSIDPHVIPCTGTPVPGGLTLREGMHLVEDVVKNVDLVALDVVELNPSLGTKDEAMRSALSVKELIFSCFQYYRGGIPAPANPEPPE